MAASASFSFNVKGQQGSIPAIGLGTVGLFGETCAASLKAASSAGYHMIDTALLYKNHASVGEGLRATGLPRDEFFVTTKVAFSPVLTEEQRRRGIWLCDPENAKGGEAASIDLCLRQLGLDYVDLLLVHSPCASVEEHGASCLPHFFELFDYRGDPLAIRPETLPDGSRTRDILAAAKLDELVRKFDAGAALEVRKRTWAAMEAALREGKCRYIGVSNYPPALLREMETYAEIMPAVDQVELHPWFSRAELRRVAEDLGIVLVAYGLGQSLRIRLRRDEAVDAVRDVAAKMEKSLLQVILRWNFQRGVASIPCSKSPDHIRENADIFGWSLSEEDMAKLDVLDEDYPYYWNPKPLEVVSVNENIK